MKEKARTHDGFNSILLHQLGYRLWDQARLTRVQKAFLIESYIYYNEMLNANRGSGRNRGRQYKNRANKRRGLESVRRQVKERYGS